MIADIFLSVKSFFMQHPVAIGFAIVLYFSKDMLCSFVFLIINQTFSSKAKTTGIAKEYVAHHKDPRFYSPVITFTANGKEYTFTDNGVYGFIDNTKNKKFTVLYNKNNPQEAEAKQPLLGYNFFVLILFLVIIYFFAIVIDSNTQKSFTDVLYKFIPQKNNDDILIIATAFTFASFGVFMFWMFNHKRIGKVKIIGEVTTGERGGTSKQGTPIYHKKIKYVYNDKEYEFKDTILATTNPPIAGEKIKMLIDPDNPDDAMVDNFWLTILFPALFIIFPIILLYIHFFTEEGFN
jgi:hypothetical protein